MHVRSQIGPICIFTRVDWEIRLRVVIEDSIAIKESAEASDLRGKIHDDYLHLNIKPQLKDVGAGLEGLLAGCEEHVPAETESAKSLDELPEFCAPAQDA